MGVCDRIKRCITKNGTVSQSNHNNSSHRFTTTIAKSPTTSSSPPPPPQRLEHHPNAMDAAAVDKEPDLDHSDKKDLQVEFVDEKENLQIEALTDQNRIQWSNPVEFLLTCIGYSVGLGNVWRFPYLCYINGGGAFLIPYSLMILFVGMPLLFMEYSFGQYFGIGSLSIFKQVCPLFQGVGIGYSILNGLVGIYYNVIIAMSLYYLFGSFSTVLPWSNCNNTWNTMNCEDPLLANQNLSWSNTTDRKGCTTVLQSTALTSATTLNNASSTLLTASSTLLTTSSTLLANSPTLLANSSTNLNIIIECTNASKSSPSDEFFRLSVLGETGASDISNLGEVRWALCLCLLLSWILVALFVSQGIKSSGKVSYFTATFPYIMLTVLVVRGVTLEGAKNGILFFIVPNWSKLAEPEVWYQAATQLFYSLNLAWGGMITMSSYNMRNHNCYRDAIVINIVSFATSMYAGLAVFSVIGYMAHESNQPIENVVKSGPGLAFIAYPRALSLMPIPQLWSVLFFFMLFLLGIGSQMVCVETIMTGIMDTWRFLVVKWQYRVSVITIVCLIGFLLGIPCTTQGGMYVLQLMDQYSAGFCVLVIAIVECLVINWIYGDKRMASHVKSMLGTKMNPFMRISWKYFSPFLILVILIFSFTQYNGMSYAGKKYPLWAEIFGWLLSMASNVPIVVVAIFVFVKAKGTTLKQKWTAATQPQVDEDSSERRHKESIYLNSKRDIGRDATMFSCDINDDVNLGSSEDHPL